MTRASLLLLLLVLVMLLHYSMNNFSKESFDQSMAHAFAHFGGTPNQSQLWPSMIKYPKNYV